MKGSAIIVPLGPDVAGAHAAHRHAARVRRAAQDRRRDIEAVPHWEVRNGLPCVAYCNEEGKLEGLPINDRATLMWWNVLGRRVDDALCGNVVVLVNLPDEPEGE